MDSLIPTQFGGFWTSDQLKERLPQIIDAESYDSNSVKTCSYEMSVGGEAFVSGDGTAKQMLDDGETMTIPPGQIALLITQETITAPMDALGFLSIKSNVKLRGLINISGFHVDPGFQGKLVFSVYNAGSQNIHLSKGSKLFLIWFCSLSGNAGTPYDGQHNHQQHIPDGAITNIANVIPSPFTLQKEIESLNMQLRTLMVLAAAIFAMFLKSCYDNSKSAQVTSSNPIKEPSISIDVKVQNADSVPKF